MLNISNVRYEGKIENDAYYSPQGLNSIGGFAGNIFMELSDEYFKVNLDNIKINADFFENSDGKMGGIGGFIYKIDTDYFDSDLSEDNYQQTNNLYITDCGVEGKIYYSGNSAGFVYLANMNFNVARSYFLGDFIINNQEEVTAFGFIGLISNVPLGLSEIKDCFAKGKATLINSVNNDLFFVFSGFIGYIAGNIGIIKNCYSAINCNFESTADFSSQPPIGEPFIMAYDFLAQNDINDYSSNEFVLDTEPTQVLNCYFDNNLNDFNVYSGVLGGVIQPKTTEQMKIEEEFVGFDFELVWKIGPRANDGYPCFWEALPIYFIETPKVKEKINNANHIIVKSPVAEYELKPQSISADKYITRVVEISDGDISVCRGVAERLFNYWNKEIKSIQGKVILRMDTNFKKKIGVIIPEVNIDEVLVLRKVEHDIIQQKTTIKAGDLILSDNEILARILAG
jgi:hypothetical protein